MNKKKLLTLSLAASLALSATAVSANTSPGQNTAEKVHVNKETKTPDLIAGKLTAPSNKPVKEIVFTYLEQKEEAYKIGENGSSNFKIVSQKKMNSALRN